TLMDNIPDSIYFKDVESRFTRINQAQAKLLGCDIPEDALGKTDFDFYSPGFAQEAFDDEQRIVKTGEPLVGKIEQIGWPNGQTRWVSVTKVPIRDNLGQVTGIVGITRDITDLKQSQEAEREQRVLAEALADVAAKLNSTLDLEEVLEHILANVGRVARHDAANVMLIESGIAHVVRHQGRMELEDEGSFEWVIAETPTLSWMVESREPLAIPDTQGSPLWIPTIRWVRSYAGAPIRLDEEVIGFIGLNGATPNMFTADHARRLQAFADQAAVAIKNAQLFGQTEQRAAYLAALNDASNRVTRWGLDLDGVLQAIVTLLVERVGVTFARIWLADDTGEHLILRASAGLHTHLDGEHARLQIASHPGHVGQIARERKPVLLNQIQGQAPFDPKWVQEHSLVSFAGYPLCKNNQLVAVLAIFNTESLDHALLDMLGSFANQAAIAIENARLYHELEIHSGILEQAVKERTAELQQTKERVETILNYNPDPILLLKPDGAIETANPAFKRVFGFDVDDLHRRLPTSLVISEHADRMQAALQSAIDEHQVVRLELVARHRDGTTFDAEVALAPIQVGDILLGVVCSVRDISALKEVERMKDAFVSNVSHELRTPITSLKLSHNLLETNPAGRERYLGRLDREISRLDDLIEDLLRLSRLDQGRVELNLQPVDLSKLAQQYANDRTPLAENKELTLLFEGKKDMLPAQADEGLIGQVLSILLTNALNYTPAGGKVTVRTHVEALDGSGWVGFSVGDTGPGITPDDQPHLFERFYRGQAGRESGAPGTGLGLAIAKEIIERHHGRIEVQSEGVPGHGSRFTVWLPASTQQKAGG
ncbi:MAG: PAS domain S-box protein, partial [Anaerolineae bacterium]|nr:PAS domain S-box protein [Anaerolineae bacterium]